MFKPLATCTLNTHSQRTLAVTADDYSDRNDDEDDQSHVERGEDYESHAGQG